LATKQPALFAELDEDKWRSTASVSPKKAPANSSTR
jgi:predicted component of type VI protein secretion system